MIKMFTGDLCFSELCEVLEYLQCTDVQAVKQCWEPWSALTEPFRAHSVLVYLRNEDKSQVKLKCLLLMLIMEK